MSEAIRVQKERLTEVIHFLHGQGWAPATSSNYSFRDAETGRVFVSASGLDKGSFQASDFIEVDMQGQAIGDARRPSAETRLHTLIYAFFPEAHCILHSHSVMNTVLSRLLRDQATLELAGYEVLKGLEGIRTHATSIQVPIFPNSQDIPALAHEIGLDLVAQSEQRYGFLLEGHGFYTWASGITAARRHMEVFEFLFECAYHERILHRS